MLSPNTLASIYGSAPLPFRPRWISRKFVIEIFLRSDPLRAAKILHAIEEIFPGSGQRFLIDVEEYKDSRVRWMYYEVWTKHDYGK